jgi:hypothetical protein
MRRLLLLAPLVLVLGLAACGGGGGADKGSGNPMADAADATAAEGSELTTTKSAVVTPDQTLLLDGEGGYNHETTEGWQHYTVKVGTASPVLDEVSIGNVLWLKSDIFSDILPAGKEWIKIDMTKATKDLGFNAKGLLGTTTADVLRRLEQTTTPVKTVGEETIDGVETTHYRGTIDPKKVPAADRLQKLTAPIFKPIDAWVDDDGLVRQVKFDYTAKVSTSDTIRAHVTLTMKLHDFGSTVDVQAPAPATVVDATSPAGMG